MKKILSLLIIGLLCFSLISLFTPKIEAAEEPQWPTFQYDARNSGLSPYPGPESSMVSWSLGLDKSFSSPVIGSDGTIYVWASGSLYAIAKTGSEFWQFPTGGYRSSTPALASDGTIYVGVTRTSDRGWGSSSTLFAVNRDGTLRWKFESDYGSMPTPIKIGFDGTIYFYVLEYREIHHPGWIEIRWRGILYALAPSGTLEWSRVLETRTSPSVTPAIGPDGTIYARSTDTVYALNPDGTTKWTFYTGRWQHMGSPTVSWDGTVLIGTASGTLYALKPDGTVKWTFGSPVGSINPSVAVDDDGNIYAVSNWMLFSLDKNGFVKWSYSSDFDISASPIVASNGIIYIVGTKFDWTPEPPYDEIHSGKVHALDFNGNLKWEYTSENAFFSQTPAISRESVLYVAGRGLYAFAHAPTHSVAYITVRYNDDIEPDYTVDELKQRADRITDYYLQQSFGEMNIGNEFVFDDWRRLSKSYSEYEHEYPDNWMARFRKIRDDAIELSGIDTRDYDAVVVVQPLNMRSFALLGARRVITTEDTPCTGGHAFSVWAHEIGHAIPDLAWHDYYRDPEFDTSGGIGYWGLMGRGTLMNPTAPVTSYNKVDAGWLEYNTIEPEAYGEYPIELLMNLDYGDNVYRYQTESGDITYYIFEGRHPPDGVEQDPEWRHEFRLERDSGILVYEVTDEGKLYTIPHDHHENDRVTLLPGDSLPFVDSGVQFTAKEIDSQLYIEIEELESTETTVVSLSTVTVTIDGSPVAEMEIEPDVDLHLYTPDGRHVGMDYTSGDYLLQIDGAESSGNILAGGPEWIAISDNLDFYIAVDPIPTRQWIEEDPLISPEDVSIDATVKLIHYDENAIREESSPIPLDIDVERPTILTRANVTKTFKPSEISAKRRGAVMSRTNITNTGYLDINEITYEDEILDGWTLKDFDHTISVTLFIDSVEYEIPYEELTYVAVEDGTYVVYINFTDGVDLYQYDPALEQEVYAMAIYAFEPGWTLNIKYPMHPPKGLATSEYSSTVSVTVVSVEGITVRVEDTATLTVT